MALSLVIPDGPAWSQRVRLDGEFFTLAVRWNDRLGAWILDVSDDAGSVLVAGVRVVSGIALLRRFAGKRESLPAGILMAIDTEGMGANPTRNDLGGRFPLLYLTEAELTS